MMEYIPCIQAKLQPTFFREREGNVPVSETLWVCRARISLLLLGDAPSNMQSSGPARQLCPEAEAVAPIAWQICQAVSNWRGQCCVMCTYASPGLHTSGNPFSLLFSGRWHYLKQETHKVFNPECRNESWQKHGWEAGQVTCTEPRLLPNIFTAVEKANTLSCISSPTK